MRLIKSLFLSLFIISQNFAQTTSEIGVWLDHLPYGRSVEVIQEGDEVFCAVENGIFIFNKINKDITRLSKLNGLSDVSVKAMAYSEATGEIILGYENANIDIIDGEQISNVSDIKLSANFPGLKTINHLFVYGQEVYISTDFGIVVLDLSNRIIGSTIIIGPSGNSIRVNQVVIDPVRDSIFAATEDGVYSASMKSPIQTYQSWTKNSRMNSEMKFITHFKNTIFVTKEGDNNNDSIFYLDGKKWLFADQIQEAQYSYVHASKGILSVCNNFSARGFNANWENLYNINTSSAGDDNFSPKAAVVDDNPNSYWVGDGSRGLYLIFQKLFIQNYNPNSPLSEKVYSMHARGDKIYVAPGEIDAVWAPQSNSGGFSRLENYIWQNFGNNLFNNYRDIVAIASDPNDPSHYFLSSYGFGIVEMKDDEFVRLINKDAVGEENLPGIGGNASHRVGGFSFDPDGNMWFTNSLTDKPLSVLYTDGSVESFSLGSNLSSSNAVKDILYTSQDQIWMQTRSSGIVVAQFSNGVLSSKKMQASENSGNLPTEKVLCFAEDKDGEIWIGTDEGVAVLFSPQNLFEPNRNFDAQQIIIDEDGDGLGEPFLGSEVVNDIEVDGANKKWFATSNSGVFYTSADGRTEIQRFNKENSPLISNNVLDIEIDDETGMVYFGTDLGLVSFQGVATEGGDQNFDVYAYPNPVQPGYEGPILIRGLVSNAQVKITDVEGNLVFETIAEGGQAIWSGKDFSGNRAKTGVYLAYITNDLGSATEVTKILIVN